MITEMKKQELLKDTIANYRDNATLLFSSHEEMGLYF